MAASIHLCQFVHLFSEALDMLMLLIDNNEHLCSVLTNTVILILPILQVTSTTYLLLRLLD